MNLGKKFTEWTCFKICFKSAPLITIYTILNTIILCIIPSIKIIATAKFIDASLSVVTKNNSLNTVIWPIVLVVIATGYTYLERSVTAIFGLKIEAALRKEYSTMLIRKIASLKYMHIENPETLDLIRRTNGDGEYNIKKIYHSILGAIVLLFQVLSVFITIMSASVLTSLLVFFISIPLLILAMKAGKVRYDTEIEITKYKRQYEYINNIESNREAVDERSLFEYTPVMEKKWHKHYEEFRKRKVWAIVKNEVIILPPSK